MIDQHTDVSVTVVICTRNRRERLTKCVDSLARQTLPRELYKILIVDTDSGDDTRAYENKLIRSNDKIGYIFEPKVGRMAAWNAGLAAVETPYVAYVDGDVTVEPEWLENLVKPFSFDEKPAVVGGEVFPIWETEKPSWLEDKWLKSYSVSLNWSQEGRFLEKEEWLSETNICFDTYILKEVSGFSERLGGNESLILSGRHFAEEVGYSQGGKLYFEPKAVVHHYIAKDRLTPRWLAKRHFWLGVSEAILAERKRRYLGQAADGWQEMRLPVSHWEWASLLNLYADSNFDKQIENCQGLGYVLQKAGLIK